MHVAMLIFRGSLETRTCIARDLFYESLTFFVNFRFCIGESSSLGEQ